MARDLLFCAVTLPSGKVRVQVKVSPGQRVGPMDVIVAARLSQLAGQTQQGLDFQDLDARDWALSEGHNVIASPKDTVSGKSAMWQRPNLKPWVTEPELMAKYDGIVAYAFDRLSRQNAEDLRALQDWARDNGKTIFIVEEGMQWPPSANWDAERIQDENKRWNDKQDQAHREWLKTSRRYRNMQRGKIRLNSITGRPNYGYTIITVTDDGITRKTQTPIQPEAGYMVEAKDRYLDGETLDSIIADFTSREIPAPGKSTQPGQVAKWSAKTLSAYLKNPAYCGRRVNANGETVHDGFTPLWSEDEHSRLVARISSRAHRAGISPKNVALLTSIIHDANGHPMYRINKWQSTAYYCRKCHAMVDLAKADNEVSQFFARNNEPYMLTETIVSDNENLIHRLRAERTALDDLADNYDDEHARLTSEIRRLSKLPKSTQIITRDSGKTYGQIWNESDDAQRRDMMREAGFTVTYDAGKWTMELGTMELGIIE
jgi:hypothetical protein